MSDAVAERWLETTLGKSFQTVTGNTPPKSRTEFYGDDVPLVKPPELINGDVSSASDGLTTQGSKFARLAPEGSTLVSCIGNLGKVGLVTTEVAFNQQINAIFPNAKIALPRFIYFLTLSPQFQEQLSALSSGTTVPIVNKSRFNSISLALPALDEQKQIVVVLDQAFAALDRARTHAEANLVDASSFEGRLLDDLIARSIAKSGGTTVPFADAVFLQEGPGIRKYEYAEPDEPSYPMINVRCVQDGHIDMSDSRSVKQEFAEGKWRHFRVDAGDILFTISGTIGRVAVVEDSDLPILMNTSVIRFRPIDQRLTTGYLYCFVKSNHFVNKLHAMSTGTAQKNVGPTHIKTLDISFPSLGEQKALTEHFEAMQLSAERAVNGYTRKLVDLAKLRQSLLQKAFSGQLT